MPYPAPQARTPEEIAVRAWVRAVLAPYDSDYPQAIGVRFSDQKAPRSLKPYATVLKLAEITLGEDVDAYVVAGDPPETILRIDSQRQATFRVIVYGTDHTRLARFLQLSMSDRRVVDDNLAAGITVADALGGLARRSRLSDGVTEDRTVIDFSVRYRLVLDRPEADAIQTAKVNTALTGGP